MPLPRFVTENMPTGGNFNPSEYAEQLKKGFESGRKKVGRLDAELIPKGYEKFKTKQYEPEQLDIWKQIYKNLGRESYLQRLAGGDEELFEEMEEPAWRKFSEAQGQIGSRYSQLAPGAMSAQRGSGFKQRQGALGREFAENLTARRQELKSKAMEDLMKFSEMFLQQKPFERGLAAKPKKEGFDWGQVASSAIQGAATVAGAAL